MDTSKVIPLYCCCYPIKNSDKMIRKSINCNSSPIGLAVISGAWFFTFVGSKVML
jgi:hypothetical protein